MLVQRIQPRRNVLCLESMGILVGILRLHRRETGDAEVWQVLSVLARWFIVCSRHLVLGGICNFSGLLFVAAAGRGKRQRVPAKNTASSSFAPR